MKRVIASLVLVLFLFNILGYAGLLMKLKGMAGSKITTKLKSELYDMGGSMTIKVPFSLPYGGYIEPDYMVNTEFKQDGEIFRVIKQRHYSDTLYLVCIRDEASTRINGAYEDFVQSFAGHDKDNQKTVKVEAEKNYLSSLIGLASIEYGWVKTIEFTSLTTTLPQVAVSPPTRPPAVA